MKGILDGVRILDLSQFLSGPHTTLLLAGMGAEVIRVDNPATGDVLSDAPLFYGADGPSLEKQAESDLGIAFAAVLGALYHRERTGVGQFVDVSMVDVLFSLVFDEPMDCYERLGLDFQQGNRVLRFCPFDTYPANDGWLVVCCGTDAMWGGVCRAMDRADLADDPDWGRMGWRVAHSDAVDELVKAWTVERPAADLIQTLTEHGVVASPVHTIDDLLKWPHLRARGMIHNVSHPVLGPMPGLQAAGFPLKFSDSATGYDGPAALTGTHNRDILTGLLGLNEDEISALSDRGVI